MAKKKIYDADAQVKEIVDNMPLITEMSEIVGKDIPKYVSILMLGMGYTPEVVKRIAERWPGNPGIIQHIEKDMVLIPAGEFMMGGGRWEDSNPVHRVKITKPFYMSKYQVTQLVWKEVMGNNPSYFGGDSDLPVERVSWNDCQEFIKKLNEMSGGGYRLPTEAEWEYASRACDTWDEGDEKELDKHAWYRGNSGGKTHEVGRKEPNIWGLYDMLGNVWERCQDWYDENYYNGSPEKDPVGRSIGIGPVIRGGSWHSNAERCTSSDRNRYAPGGRDNSLGLRLVRSYNGTEVI